MAPKAPSTEKLYKKSQAKCLALLFLGGFCNWEASLPAEEKQAHGISLPETPPLGPPGPEEGHDPFRLARSSMREALALLISNGIVNGSE